MPSSGMFRRMALVRTDVSEERITSTITVIGIIELGLTLAVICNAISLLCHAVSISSQRASVASYC
jgi:hypothetical protein